jgi:hypothetical protein
MVGDFPPVPGLVWSDAFGWQPAQQPAPVIRAQGCICPPTSEKTCENPTCPRQKPKM